ncbi:MAG: S-layer protein domain-containing protein [Candidatus Methanoperedens sp.]|nr:S-layer protein domain-containing protein [Candidatus Methanoperedens sp.]
MTNSESTTTLSSDSTIDVFGNVKLRVADDEAVLRYYPFVMRTEPGTYEVRGSVAGNDTSNWNSTTFAGFFYDIDDNLGTETLTITAGPGPDYRSVGKSNITYNTTGQKKMLKVVDAKYNDSGTEAAAKGLEQFDKMADTSGYYTIIGWMAEKYVAIKKQPNKLSKLMVEHGTSSAEKKTLTVGETWEIGGGYTLTANSIDAKASPRQVWLTLSKDGVKKDDKVVTSGGADSQPIYTYVEKSLCGETDVPIFVTYVDSVFAGATTDMVQFRYTWLINPTCTEVKSSDTFGIMKVTSTSGKLELTNSESTTTLSSDSTIDVFGNVKLRVADDSDALRYYPFVEYVIEGEGVTPTGTPTATVVGTPTNVTVTTPTVTETIAAQPVTATPTPTKTKEEPGFEAVFAIAGLLAVAFLVLRQKK